ncbi:MAG: hypothetical protein FJY29_07830 [Betaproteobacteria bacterium]|nr:hypothetical protein [Betaproteobacteria bacterium]
MTQGKKPQLVESLQANVTDFFNKFHEKHQKYMKCAAGCAQCCRVHLSVFPVEAQLIFSWWKVLPASEQKKISASWRPIAAAAESSVEATPECFFLAEKSCSIYPVRPVICRSQGLPLKMAEIPAALPQQSGNYELSLCELNFEQESSLPAPAEWLDLERLNTLLALAQQHTPEDDLDVEINLLAKQHLGRVPLAELGRLLLRNMS